MTLTRERLSKELKRLEHEYRVSSWEFYERYHAGNLEEADSDDFMRWAWLCSIALRNGTLAPEVVSA